MVEKQAKNETLNTNLYILKALESGEKYGYEIIDAVNSISNNKLVIKQATLYSNLKRLEQKKLISSYWKDSEIGGKRHYYYITDSGLKYLQDNDHNISTHKEIITQEPIPVKEPSNVEIIDIQTVNSNSTKAFWAENKYFASKMLNGNDNDPTEKFTQKKETVVIVDEPKQVEENTIKPIVKEEIKEEKVGSKRDAVLLDQNTIIPSSYAAYSMENRPINTVATTDIDYKNILGELYSEKESFNAKSIQEQQVDINQYSNTQYVDDIVSEQQNYFEEQPSKEEVQQIKLKSIVNNFSNYKIKVKPHNKLYQVNINSDEYIKSNKLQFALSIVTYSFFALLLFIANLILSGSQIANTETILLTTLGIGAIYPIASLVILLFNPYKKSRNSFNFKYLLTVSFLGSLVAMIFVIAICLLCGMTNMNQAKYIFFWLIPALIALCVIAYPIFKNLLIKSKKFNC